MRTAIRTPSRLLPLTFAYCLILGAPAMLHSQAAPSASAGSGSDVIQDLALSADERQRFIGLYTVGAQSPGQPSMSIRFREGGDALIGQVDDNAPTRMLYQGGNVFRPEAATAFVITFTVEGNHATRFSMVSPEGNMEGTLVTGQGGVDLSVESDGSTSGGLYVELAVMDSLLFNAAYVSCDAPAVNDLLTDDVEFYHDQTGFRSGEEVQADFRRLTANCPRNQGVTRELVKGSLRVYTIKDYGAVQMGAHRFVRADGSFPTIAQFVHLWKKVDGAWGLARVLSFDHRSDDAAVANSMLQRDQ